MSPQIPALDDMIGAHIEYIYAEPYGYPAMVETGTIKSLKELRDGRLEIYVIPDNPKRMPKYRIAEDHLLRYIQDVEFQRAIA